MAPGAVQATARIMSFFQSAELSELSPTTSRLAMRMQAMLALWIETSRGATANAVDASYASSRGLLLGRDASVERRRSGLS